MTDVTRLVSDIDSGDARAAETLLALLYDELRTLAAAKLARERPGQTLQATALVHEAYLRLVDEQENRAWSGRGHFFGAAAEAMRRILVENARRKKRHKRGGQWNRVDQEVAEIACAVPDDDILALNEALSRLDERDPQKARLVELRFFAGLTNEQAAEALEISASTAKRQWSYARAWLHREVHGGESPATD